MNERYLLGPILRVPRLQKIKNEVDKKMGRATNNTVRENSRKTTMMIWTCVRNGLEKDTIHGNKYQSARN